MQIGIGINLTGGRGQVGFSPLEAFSGSLKGLWLDQSDITTGFQDSAGTTPQTASGQFTGKRLDKSGRANHVLQAGASARPEFDIISGISSDFFDPTDDGYSTAAFAAGTLTATMDLFVTIKRAATAQNVVFSQAPADGTRFGGLASSGVATSGSAVSNGGAAWTLFVNGVQIAGTGTASGADLNTALGSGSYKVMEFRDLNLALWTQFTLGLYTGFMLNADIAQVVLCESQPALRNNLRTHCGAKGGLSL